MQGGVIIKTIISNKSKNKRILTSTLVLLIVYSIFITNSIKADEIVETEDEISSFSLLEGEEEKIVPFSEDYEGFALSDTLKAPAVYSVHRLDANGGFGSSLLSTGDFASAKKRMEDEAKKSPNVVVTSSLSKSPFKIVAADRAIVQSYPYRTGVQGSSIKAMEATQTLSIYSDLNLNSSATYIPAHYKMNYHGTELSSSNNPVLNVTINGGSGYVDVVKTDIIPMLYVEKGIPMTLGGSENFYTNPEKAYTMRVKADYYLVNWNDVRKKNEVTITYRQAFPTLAVNEITYSLAPDWLPVGVYYSMDGIRFYTDIDLKKPVKNNGTVAEFYAYFQWLPLRTQSDLTADNIKNDLKSRVSKKSIITGHERSFIENGNKYGVNPLLLYAQAGLESAYGTSNFAHDRANLFGWNAFDSNPELAASYEGVNQSIESQANANIRVYMNQRDWRFEGYAFGNKGSGISVRYASDPYYGNKISAIAYTTSRNLNYVDYNKYSIGKIKDKQDLNVRKDSSTNSSIWYTTPQNKINQLISILGEQGSFYKSNLSRPINRTTQNIIDSFVEGILYPVDLNTEFGFFSKDYVSKVSVQSTANVANTTGKMTGIKRQFIVNNSGGLNLRSGWTTTGTTVLTTIPVNTVIHGEFTNNGWVKVTHAGKTGYVSFVHLDEYSTNTPVNPPINPPVNPPVDPSKPSVRGDVDGNGKVNLRDLAMVQGHLLKINLLTGENLIRADVDGNGKVNLRDLAMIQGHLLRVNLLD